MALGNALSDPINMLEYADFAYQTGLVDIHGKNIMRLFELLAKEYYPSIESKIVRKKCILSKPISLIAYLLLFVCLFVSLLIILVLGHNVVRLHTKQQLQ